MFKRILLFFHVDLNILCRIYTTHYTFLGIIFRLEKKRNVLKTVSIGCENLFLPPVISLYRYILLKKICVDIRKRKVLEKSFPWRYTIFMNYLLSATRKRLTNFVFRIPFTNMAFHIYRDLMGCFLGRYTFIFLL